MNDLEFCAGIIRAHDEGLITYHNNSLRYFGDTDEDAYNIFAHNGGLREGNIREPKRTLHKILNFLTTNQRATMLELGPGIGICTQQISQAFGDAVSIDAIGISPVNPYVAINLRHSFAVLYTKHLFAQNPKERKHDRIIPRERIFDSTYAELITCNNPHIHHQDIGYYPEDIPNREKRYDLIHDACGPLFHSRDVSGALWRALSQLKPQGVLYCSQTLPLSKIALGLGAYVIEMGVEGTLVFKDEATCEAIIEYLKEYKRDVA